MSHAVKVHVLNVIITNTNPAQEPTGFKAQCAAKDKAGSVAAVKAVIAPTLFS